MGVMLAVFFVCQHKAEPTTVEAVQALMTADFLFIFAGIMERERESNLQLQCCLLYISGVQLLL